MKMVLINRKIFIVLFIVILMVSIYLNIISFTENSDWEKKYETLVCVANQFDDTKVVSFIAASNESPVGAKYIEVFDVNEGRVVNKLEITEEIKKEAIQNINNITGLYVKVKPLPDNGKIIRVPLGNGAIVNNKWVEDAGISKIEEVFFIYPEIEKTYILILDSNYRPFFFTFEGDDEKLRSFLDTASTNQ